MDHEHYNELVKVSHGIYEQATDQITNYCAAKYCGVGNTAQQQFADYLFVAEEVSAYLLGNALALLSPDAQEGEIKGFVEDLRRVISVAGQKLGSDQNPS